MVINGMRMVSNAYLMARQWSTLGQRCFVLTSCDHCAVSAPPSPRSGSFLGASHTQPNKDQQPCCRHGFPWVFCAVNLVILSLDQSNSSDLIVSDFQIAINQDHPIFQISPRISGRGRGCPPSRTFHPHGQLLRLDGVSADAGQRWGSGHREVMGLVKGDPTDACFDGNHGS